MTYVDFYLNNLAEMADTMPTTYNFTGEALEKFNTLVTAEIENVKTNGNNYNAESFLTFLENIVNIDFGKN